VFVYTDSFQVTTAKLTRTTTNNKRTTARRAERSPRSVS